MGLAFYDTDQNLIPDGESLRAQINGHRGGDHQVRIYIRNDSPVYWYTNIVLSLASTLYDGYGALGTSGISYKFLYGARQPTEAEWDSVLAGESLSLPNIGDTDAADTSTYHPIWIRTYVPGNTKAAIYDTYSLELTFLPRVVGF